jgi:hypothetical protein
MKMHLKNALICFLMILCGIHISCRSQDYSHPQKVQRPAHLEPDYSGIVIPPNIAPLNFVIREKAARYHVKIFSTKGESIEIHSETPAIKIPLSPWQELLMQNTDQEIQFVITIQDSSGEQWLQFEPIRNKIAREKIDRYLVYRLMPPLYIFWKKMGIYQRDLESYDVKQILSSKPLNDGCFNCHSFLNNSPDKWIVHLRGAPVTGMLLNRGEETVLVKTQTEFNKAPAGHPIWHPGGNYIAFSAYKVRQFFHAEGVNRDVLDFASDIILYRVDSNTITSCQSIADSNYFETYPAWSPDGKWLYFCSTPRFDTVAVLRDHNYREVKYDLMRIGFDTETGKFGKIEKILASAETGMSITFPRFSPDGKYLLFSMSSYGNFPLARSGGHLYVMEMDSGQIRKLECNGENSDSYHSWSSNGRWIVFSSRRDDGISARPYFTYFDEQGVAAKAFILPQEDPDFYESELQTFNIPELITGPISQKPQDLIKVARQTDQIIKARYIPPAQ